MIRGNRKGSQDLSLGNNETEFHFGLHSIPPTPASGTEGRSWEGGKSGMSFGDEQSDAVVVTFRARTVSVTVPKAE